MAYVILGAGALCGLLRCVLGYYVFSACTSVLCACAVALSPNPAGKLPLIAGLLVSVMADWFLAHQNGGQNRFLYGVMGFFAAHCMFAWYALKRFAFRWEILATALVLLAIYTVYMSFRELRAADKPLRAPLFLYMMVSVLSLYCACSCKVWNVSTILYAVGIAAILFSDTMIGENEFMHQAWARKLVLPTYYLCHVLISLSAILA